MNIQGKTISIKYSRDNFVELCLLVYEAQYKIVGEKQSKIDTWTSWPQFNEAVIIGELGPCGINVEYIG